MKFVQLIHHVTISVYVIAFVYQFFVLIKKNYMFSCIAPKTVVIYVCGLPKDFVYLALIVLSEM